MLNFRKRFFLLIAIIGVAFTLTACTKSDDYVKVAFDSDEYVIKVGEVWDVTPIISKGSKVGAVTVEYSSADEKVATYENGVLKGLYIGETTIKIVCTEQPIAYDVAVVKVVEHRLPTVEFSELEPTMLKNDKQTLSYSFIPELAKANVAFFSANEDVAVVDENGVITAVGVGHAVIVAQVSDSEDSRDYVFELDVIESDFAINYELNGGELGASSPSGYNVLDLPTALVDATRTDYNFLGWYDNPECEGTPVTEVPVGQYGDYTVYAKWELAVFDITYNLDGGENHADNPAQYNINNLPLVLAEPTKENFVFKGWYLDGQLVTEIAANTRGAVELKARWYDPNAEYAITYNLDGGENHADNPAKFVSKDGVAELKDPTKVGYTFEGWFADATFKDAVERIEAGLEAGVALYAKWSLNKYTIEYNLDGGSFVKDVTVPEYDSFDAFGAAFVADYQAFYQLKDVTVENFYGKSSSYGLYGFYLNAEMTAKWGWVLEYVQAKAVAESYYKAASLEIASGAALFNAAARANFAALLQQTSMNSTSPLSMNFAGVSSEEAFWNACPTKVVQEKTDAPKEYTVLDAPLELAKPTKAGYVFFGWYEAADLSGAPVTSIAASQLGNKVLYAKWEVAPAA